MDDLIGTVIKIEDEDLLKVLESIKMDRDQARALLTDAAFRLEQNDKTLWECLYAKYPNLKDYHIAMRWPDYEIHIERMKRDYEKK